MSQTPQLRIDIERVALLSVTGYLDDTDLRKLQRAVDGLLLDGGARLLAARGPAGVPGIGLGYPCRPFATTCRAHLI